MPHNIQNAAIDQKKHSLWYLLPFALIVAIYTFQEFLITKVFFGFLYFGYIAFLLIILGVFLFIKTKFSFLAFIILIVLTLLSLFLITSNFFFSGYKLAKCGENYLVYKSLVASGTSKPCDHKPSQTLFKVDSFKVVY